MDDSLTKLGAAIAAESFEGSQLARSVGDNPICHIAIDPAVPCLVVSWRKNATSLQLRFVLENIIDILTAERLHKLMGDDGGIFRVSAEDQEWVAQDWMPRAMRAGLLVVASVVPFSYSGKLALERVHAAFPSDVAIRSFDGVDEAKDWLRNQKVD